MGDIVLYTEQAKRFKEKYEPELYKPYVLEFDETLMGQCEDTTTRFIIRLNPTLASESQDAHDANFCHELYHAVQISRGYPTYASNAGYSTLNTRSLEGLRSILFDMGVYEALRNYDIDNSYFINGRLNWVLSYADTDYKEVADDWKRDEFFVNFILSYMSAPTIRTKRAMKLARRFIPNTAALAYELSRVITTYGYSTPHEAFTSLSHIIDFVEAWYLTGISFRGHFVGNMTEFEKLSSTLQ